MSETKISKGWLIVAGIALGIGFFLNHYASLFVAVFLLMYYLGHKQ